MREYICTSGPVTISGVTTLAMIKASGAPSVNLEFLRFWIGYSANATSAQQRVKLSLTSGTPTGTAFTPIKLKEQDAASVITGSTTPGAGNLCTNVTTEVANLTSVHEDTFNVLNGWLYVPTPSETRIHPAGATSGISLGFPVSPSTLTGWSFGMHWREI